MIKRVWKNLTLLAVVMLALAGCGKQTGPQEIQKFNKAVQVVTNQETAADLGYDLENMHERGFVIANRDGKTYLLAPTQDGADRAATFFLKHYVDEEGKISIPSGETYVENGRLIKEGVYVGETPISDYTIAYGSKAVLPICEQLQYYVHQTGGHWLELTSKKKAGEHAIVLSIDKSIEGVDGFIEVVEGQVSIKAKDEVSLWNEMYQFVNLYLGWKDTGTDEEHISSVSSVARVPFDYMEKEAWIEEREAIITLWNVNYARGLYLDSDVSLKNNLIDYSEDQLYEYVKMLKYCGYTGIQVTEMCSTWAGVGTYQASNDKIRMLADAAHSLDMKFTLWVWGAEFSDNGWVDTEVTYAYDGNPFNFHNPDVVASFDKYYDRYAELADCCDRVIGHYYDPGNVYSAEEIGYYAKMLKDKFLAVNPDIDFGVSCWVDVYDKSVIVKAVGTDVTLYECGHRDDENTYVAFRTEINNLGCRLGTWAWNTCEMEIDQLAQMNFNMDIIRSVYQTARKYDSIAKPTYWSEMDSYHVLNVFSLFCAGQMLIDPDVPSEALYEQIATATVGPEHAAVFAEMLSIIQDARSGSTWDTYFWTSENYILKSDAYPAQDILDRCEKVLPYLQEMIDDKIEAYTLPLPIPLLDVLRMMQPHLVQIRDYAQFRLDFAQLQTDVERGISAAELQTRLIRVSDPIKNYNTVIGAWGQVEARAQYELITEYCEKIGASVPMHGAFQEERKQRILAQFKAYQKEAQTPNKCYDPYYQFGLAYGAKETARLVQEMVEEGLLIRSEDGSVYLSDWEKYAYHFDS